MTYTINGKEWTEFDINKRCAQLLGLKDVHENNGRAFFTCRDWHWKQAFEPCTDPSDTWPIIEKYWERLHSKFKFHPLTDWEFYASKYESKLVAACICFIEENEA